MDFRYPLAVQDVPPRTTRRHYVWLGLILLVGLGLRAGYMSYALQTPGYTWQDPDGYILKAQRLARSGTWRWTFDAVSHEINYRRHALPPGFSVFLSFFLLFPGFPLTAQIALMLLGLAIVALLFELGRLVHSPAAGLIAAAAYAVAVPYIIGVWSTSQEGLYIPLILLAFVVVGRAILADARPWRFALAGVLFGLAALTRSMPLFYVVPAAAAMALLAHDRTRGAKQALAFAAGFLLPTVPYSIALSLHFGELAIIDTHGSIHQRVSPGARAPGIAETAAALWEAFASDPGAFTAQTAERARSLLHINGGRILQIYVIADTYVQAAVWKAIVHAGTDVLLILSAILAPIGAAVARHPRIAVLWVLWAAINVAIASLGGFSGARLRAPFEPFMIVLAAVVIAGGWQLRKRWLIPAIALSAAIGAAVLPQLPRSLAAWPDYGVDWPSIWVRDSGAILGPAGVNIPAFAGRAEFSLGRGEVPDHRAERLAVDVRGGGVVLASRTIAPGATERFSLWWPRRGLAFLTIDVRATDGTAAGELRILVPRR
jgi:4-amino-4-deoxy-L-arabinose transferase-like glycosyltransferase